MKKNNNYLWILACSVLAIFCLVLWHSNHELKQENQTQSSQIEKLQKKNKKLKRENVVIDQKDNQGEFTQANETVQHLFNNLENWNADNWLSNQQTAEEYATKGVIQYFGGGNGNKKNSQAQKQLQDLNASSTLVESNIYFSPESVDGDNINGVFIGTVQTNSNESDSKQTIHYQFMYNKQKDKVTNLRVF
nr:hypothetical protein [uncultured Ligilactobacillus sp.]